MSNGYSDALQRLNDNQRIAATDIEGPMLVLAGPGTGKTTVLTTRVASILQSTDTPASGIVCLTFTESAAENMRIRLQQLIGVDAYAVQISTYHAFGSSILREFADYFEMGEMRPIDDIERISIVTGLLEDMPFSNPIKSLQYSPGDVISTISEVKRARLDSEQLKALANANSTTEADFSENNSELLSKLQPAPRTLAAAEPVYSAILKALETHKAHDYEQSSIALAAAELKVALNTADTEGKSTPLTKWKNAWLEKNSSGAFELGSQRANQRLAAFAEFMTLYATTLKQQGLFDFDDMILTALNELQSNAELRYAVQEKYHYILLDEFQDTNRAQFDLIKTVALSDASNFRPNIMAVGDDDQAIYAFQGAESSNMLDFINAFTDTKVVNLDINYRSHPDILHVAHGISEQIESRLHHSLDSIDKQLKSGGLHSEAQLERHEFITKDSELDWITSDIKAAIDGGADPNEIAVLAPKHSQLEELAASLHTSGVAVQYEKRENILDAPLIKEVELLLRLVQSIQDNEAELTTILMPKVLACHYFELPIAAIASANWELRKEGGDWAQIAYKHATLHEPITAIYALALRASTMNIHAVLDQLIGVAPIQISQDRTYTMPLRSFYFSRKRLEASSLSFSELLSQLQVLIRLSSDRQQASEQPISIQDILATIDGYRAAGQPVLNTIQLATDSSSAVTLLTVFKAKGLEFDTVYTLSVADSIWGPSARRNHNKLALPKNLQYIRHKGTSDELLRIFFVAATRARTRLVVASHTMNAAGKSMLPLRYLLESQPDKKLLSDLLPDTAKVSQSSENGPGGNTAKSTNGKNAQTLTGNEIDISNIAAVLEPKLRNYQLSPTHVTKFIDLEYGGPESVLFDVLLQFPSSTSDDGIYGNIMHASLHWFITHLTDETGSAELIEKTISEAKLQFERSFHDEATRASYWERGEAALRSFLQEKGSSLQGYLSEVSFKHESAFVGRAHMSGIVDAMKVDEKSKTIHLVDFKTGNPTSKWGSSLKLHKYKLQLYCYKLLIECSKRYKGYTVESAALLYLEPDQDGQLHTLDLNFKDDEVAYAKGLIEAVWSALQNSMYPETAGYPRTVSGVREFEKWLLNWHDNQ